MSTRLSRWFAVAISILSLVSLGGCGDGDPSAQQTPDSTTSAEAQMNIDEGKAHYRRVITEIRRVVTCQGRPLTWTEKRAESIEPSGPMNDQGTVLSYTYRGPFLSADQACTGDDFTAAVDAITSVLKKNGGVADDVNLDPDATQGGEVKWRDHHGAVYTFSSGGRTSLSMVSGELPRD